MVDSNLPKSAKQTIAEAREMGAPPENDINLEWNDMIMSFEEKDKERFYYKSRRVQALSRVLINDYGCFARVKSWLKKARLFVYNDEWKLADMFVERARDVLEEKGREISPVVR